MNKFKIHLDRSGRTSFVELNGQRLRGVIGVSIEKPEPRTRPVVTLTLGAREADVTVEDDSD